MAMVRSDFTRLLQQEMSELFWDTYTEVTPVWQTLFTERPITTPYVERQSMLGMGDLEEKKENEPFSYDTPTAGWPVLGAVRSFGKAVAFSYELYNDSQFRGLFAEVVSQIAENYPRTRDRYFANIFNQGALINGHGVFNNTIAGVKADPTGNFIYDNKPLFAAEGNGHPALMSSQLFANYMALSLTCENLVQVYNAMTINNAYDEQANKIVLNPDTLVVPQELKLQAMQVLNTEFLPTTSGVASTQRNPLYRAFDLVVWPHLTDRDGWFLVQRKKGMTVLTRQAPTIDVWTDPETKQYKASIYCRFGAYVDNWRYAFACNTQQS